MNSEEIDRYICKFLTRTIDNDELEILVAWIKESDEHKTYVQNLININQVANMQQDTQSVDSEKAFLKVWKEINYDQKKKINLLQWWQRIAAILIIPLLAWAIYTMISSPKTETNALVFQEITSPPGTKSNITLPDGTNVWLNSGSKLKFPLQFTSNERKVFLIGEGFFKVKSDKKHPFIVQTHDLDVRATGTEFNVDSYPNDTITSVSLKEGIVNVIVGGKRTLMRPNEHFVYNNSRKASNLVAVNASNVCAWKDGILVFRNEPLENVFKRISRTYNVDIEVKDQAVAHQLYRATFEKESLDEILRLLQLSAPIKYKRSEREISGNDKFNKEKIEVYKN